MSKEGVRTNFCNPGRLRMISYHFAWSIYVILPLFCPVNRTFFIAGSVHETHTITETFDDVVLVSGSWSAEFSWFPGYSWRFVHCALCHNHLGWKYYSQTLRPKTFVGLTGMSILFENLSSTDNRTDQDTGTDTDEAWMHEHWKCYFFADYFSSLKSGKRQTSFFKLNKQRLLWVWCENIVKLISRQYGFI